MDIENIIKANPKTIALALSVFGYLFGVLTWWGKLRWSDSALSYEELLSRANDGSRLSKRSTKRLEDEVPRILKYWRTQLEPPRSGVKFDVMSIKDNMVIAKKIDMGHLESHCPIYSEENDINIIYINANPDLDNNGSYLTQSINDCINKVSLILKEKSELIKGSDGILRYCADNMNSDVIIWVSVNFVEIKSAESVTVLFNKIKSEIKNYIPNCKVCLEIYISDAFRNDLSKIKTLDVLSKETTVHIDETNQSSIEKMTSTALYAYSHNIACKMLKNEGILIDFNDFKKRNIKWKVDETILTEKFIKLPHILNKSWNYINIYGLPGTGKTDFSLYIIDKLVECKKSIVIVLNSEEAFSILYYFCFKKDFEESKKALLNGMQYHISSALNEKTEASQAYLDVLNKVMIDEPSRIVFLLDDYILGKSSVLNEILNKKVLGNQRIIIVGRAEIKNLSGNSIKIPCLRWKKENANKILQSWAKNDKKSTINNSLERGWAQNREDFSTYHLRVIFKYSDRLEQDPTEFVRNELKKITAPVEEEFKGIISTPEKTLTEIKKLIINDGSLHSIRELIQENNDLDVGALLGFLSWSGRYELANQGPLNKITINYSNVSKWSKGIIGKKDIGIAKSFIESCIKAGIFASLPYGAGAIWDDKFLADGFAALYLCSLLDEYQSDEAVGSTVATMLKDLDEGDSIDILWFVLGLDSIISIIRIVAKFKPELGSVIDQLLTDEIIILINDDDNGRVLLESIGHEILKIVELGYITTKEIVPVSRAFSRLADNNQNIKSLIDQSIKNNDRTALLAVSCLATKSISVDDFFRKADELMVEKSLSLEVGYSNFTNPEDSQARAHNLDIFIKRFIDLEAFSENESKLSRLWEKWCKLQTTEDLINVALINLLTMEYDNKQETYITSLFVNSLKDFHSRQNWKHFFKKDTFVCAIPNLLSQKRIGLLSELVDWLAVLSYPDYCRNNGQWVINKSGNAAIQKIENKPLNVKDIFAFMSNNEGLSLPKTNLLKSLNFTGSNSEV